MTDQTPTPPAGASTVAVQRAPGTRRRPPQPATGLSGSRYRVVLADDPQTWSVPEHPGDLLALPPDERLAGFERLTEDGAALVVLCGRRSAAAVAREVALARGTLESTIAVVPLPGGPLGRYAMGRIAESALASAAHPPAVVIGLLPALAADLVDVGLVSSVTALDMPGVKLGHHLSSYVPGAKLFAVQVTPAPYVARVGSAGLGPGIEAFATPDFGPVGARILLAGSRGVPEGLAQHWGVTAPPGPVSAPLPMEAFWHDQAAGEVVVVPDDPAAWVALRIPTAAFHPCGWCGEPLADEVRSCVFCGHTPLRATPPDPLP